MKVTTFPAFTIEHDFNTLCRLIYLSATNYQVFFHGSGRFVYSDTEQESEVHASLLMNDTFYYACADAEDFDVKDIDTIMDLYLRFDYDGPMAFASRHRGEPVLNRLDTDRFKQAVGYLENPTEPKLDINVEPIITDIKLLNKLLWLAGVDFLGFYFKEDLEEEKTIPVLRADGKAIYASATWTGLIESDINQLIDVYSKFAHTGLDAWTTAQLGKDPLGEYRQKEYSPEYHQALIYLKGENDERTTNN